MLKKLTAWFRKKNIDMTQGPIGSRLVAFTLPILLGELFQHFYTLADSAIIGNFAGRSALAAVGASESIVRVLVGFFNGVSVGFTVVIARYFGAKDTEKLNRSVNNALYLALMIGILMTVGGLLLLRPVLRLMDTPEETFENAVSSENLPYIYSRVKLAKDGEGQTVLPYTFNWKGSYRLR